jgi:hypothetical protein
METGGVENSGRMRKPCDGKVFGGLCLLIVAVLGCARWSNLKDEVKAPEASFKAAEMAVDLAPVEIIFLRLGPEQVAALDSVWPRVNEQFLSVEKRQALDANGVRVAKVDAVVPLPLQKMIDAVEKRLSEDPLEQAGVAADMSSHSRLYQCRKHERKEVNLGATRKGSIVLLYNEKGVARGSNFDEPQLLFDLKAYPRGDNSTVVSLIPEMQHGPFKQKFVTQEYALRREMKRDTLQWSELAIEDNLQAGQSLLLTGLHPPRGVGEHFFFTDTASGSREQVLMLLRVGPNALETAFTSKR